MEKLYELRKFAEQLAAGIDPTTNIPFKDDTILNIDVIKKYNRDVMEILDKIIRFKGFQSVESKGKTKIPFYLTKEVKDKIVLSEKPISISELCYSLNDYVANGMKRIRATQITNWLTNKGYLVVEEWGDNQYLKKPTDKGIELGIAFLEKKNKYGNVYGVNQYDLNAQKFVIDNLENIIFGE